MIVGGVLMYRSRARIPQRVIGSDDAVLFTLVAAATHGLFHLRGLQAPVENKEEDKELVTA